MFVTSNSICTLAAEVLSAGPTNDSVKSAMQAALSHCLNWIGIMLWGRSDDPDRTSPIRELLGAPGDLDAGTRMYRMLVRVLQVSQSSAEREYKNEDVCDRWSLSFCVSRFLVIITSLHPEWLCRVLREEEDAASHTQVGISRFP